MFALKKKPDEVSDGSLVRMLKEGLSDSSEEEDEDEDEDEDEEGKGQGQKAAPSGPKLKMMPNVARKNSSAARKKGAATSAPKVSTKGTAGGKSVQTMTLTEEEAAMNGAPGTLCVRTWCANVRIRLGWVGGHGRGAFADRCVLLTVVGTCCRLSTSPSRYVYTHPRPPPMGRG